MLNLIIAAVGIAMFLFVVVWVVRAFMAYVIRNEEMVPGGSHGRQTRRVKDERPE
jgi:hypothetical protein